MASDAEVKAGVVAIEDDLRKLIDQFVPEYVGFVPARAKAHEKLAGDQGQEIVKDGVHRVLVAAEQVRGASHGG